MNTDQGSRGGQVYGTKSVIEIAGIIRITGQIRGIASLITCDYPLPKKQGSQPDDCPRGESRRRRLVHPLWFIVLKIDLSILIEPSLIARRNASTSAEDGFSGVKIGKARGRKTPDWHSSGTYIIYKESINFSIYPRKWTFDWWFHLVWIDLNIQIGLIEFSRIFRNWHSAKFLIKITEKHLEFRFDAMFRNWN